jgi:hypothetical protein
MNDKFTIEYDKQKIILNNIDQLLLDTYDKLIEFKNLENMIR